MKLIKTVDAEGAVLCHDITQIIKGVTKDAVFRKGHIVTREDIPVLLSVGKDELYVWEKEEGMMHENDAAEVLISMCIGDHMDKSGVKEGKIELSAACDGLLKVNEAGMRAVNGFGQMMIASRHGNCPVKKGDKLAFYHKAEDGIDGYDVEGNILKSTRGKEQTILAGNGFQMDSDRCTYYAKIDGMVKLDGDRLEVSEMLEVDEINSSIGNIVFNGSVHVRGNVGAGVTIRAGKDIIVDGFIEGATLEAAGEIILRKGMNGSGKGKIKAGGNVTAKFLESADVYAGGMIHIDYSMNSILYSEETVEAKLRNGTIVGGVCTGVKGVSAQNIGTKAAVQTTIRAGSSTALMKLNNEIYRQLSSTKEEIRILENVRREMEGKLNAEQLAEQPVYEKVQNALYTKGKESEELVAKQEEVRARLMELSRAVIEAKGTIYDGVKVWLGEVSWNSEKDLTDVTLRKVRKGSEEKVFAYHNSKDPKDPDAIIE